MLLLKEQIRDLHEKIEKAGEDKKTQEKNRKELSGQLADLAEEYDRLVKQIANSGYENLKTELQVSMNSWISCKKAGPHGSRRPQG